MSQFSKPRVPEFSSPILTVTLINQVQHFHRVLPYLCSLLLVTLKFQAHAKFPFLRPYNTPYNDNPKEVAVACNISPTDHIGLDMAL
jgi:hypothetical protein